MYGNYEILILYCMNFYDELKKICIAVNLFKNEYGHEINNKILLKNVIYCIL